jgi:hypothetical protein
MAKTIAPADADTIEHANLVVSHLRAALSHALKANSPRTADKIRAAIKSAGGALRHAQHRARTA